MVHVAKLAAGTDVDGYTLVEQLGRGGNGEVWKATASDGAFVALKVLTRRGEEAVARFQRESLLQTGDLAGFPGLLPVLDAAAPSSIPPWLAMPIAEPITKALGDAPLVDVIAAVATISETLQRLHDRGYAHRDIKPGNLYRHCGQWVIGDLGLIDLPRPTPLTVGARAIGPRYFLAPEMLLDAATATGGPADVYALAKTLWVLLVGAEVPPPGTHSSDERALRVSTYVSHPRVAFLDQVVERATAYNPKRRPTAAGFARELRLVLEGTTERSGDAELDLSSIREDLLLAAANSQCRADRADQRRVLGDDLVEQLVTASAPLVDLLAGAGVQLRSRQFRPDSKVLDRASNWMIPRAERREGRVLVAELTFETGLIGPNSVGVVELRSGFGVITSSEGEAAIVVAHVVNESVAWSDTRLVTMGSLDADQAVRDLTTALIDHSPDGLAAFLAMHTRMNTRG